MSTPAGSLDSGHSVQALEVCATSGQVKVMAHTVLFSTRLDENERGDLIHAIHLLWDLAFIEGQREAYKHVELAGS